jgi:hypothetical protein
MAHAYRMIAHKVEAVRWDGDLTPYEMPNWLYAALYSKKTDSEVRQVGRQLHVQTPNGLAIADKGDWIVRNQRRELSVYKPEQFNRTFEPDERKTKTREPRKRPASGRRER